VSPHHPPSADDELLFSYVYKNLTPELRIDGRLCIEIRALLRGYNNTTM
jgi:hypothetical protein